MKARGKMQSCKNWFTNSRSRPDPPLWVRQWVRSYNILWTINATRQKLISINSLITNVWLTESHSQMDIYLLTHSLTLTYLLYERRFDDGELGVDLLSVLLLRLLLGMQLCKVYHDKVEMYRKCNRCHIQLRFLKTIQKRKINKQWK